MQLFREPNPPAPEIILEMPPTRTLKIVVDRLKSMDPSLMITIDDKGSLTLRIMKISLSVQTIFPYLKLRQDLRAPLEEATHENDEEEEKEENPTAVVDSKMFSQTLLLDESITKLLLCCKSKDFMSD
jgi:hypothetical protein